MKARYDQPPVGWWQDGRGVNQPPGSYADPSLRTGAGGGGAAGGPRARFAARRRARRSAPALPQTPTP